LSDDLSLPPERRLSRSSTIQSIFDEGDIFKGRYCHLFRGQKNQGLTRAAFVVSEKSASKATLRNRIKRLMRESFRLLQPKFDEEGWPLVLVATRSVHDGLKRQDFDADIRGHLDRAGIIEASGSMS
jgi:ribonuclease P protein component